MPDERVPMSKIAVWPLIKQSGAEWSEDKASKMAASLAYYTVSSLAPIFVVVLGVGTLVAHDKMSPENIKASLGKLLDPKIAESLADVIKSSSAAKSGLVATILGIVIALFSAAGVFGELQDSLNTIWEVKPKPGLGVAAWLKARFLSMSMVLGVAFLLLVSTVLTSVISSVSGGTLAKLFGEKATAAAGGATVLSTITQIVLFFVTTGVVTVLFAGIFKLLPDVIIKWRDVLLGGFLTAILFQIGKFGLSKYFTYASPGSAFGAVGSIVVLIVWVYYSAQILFFGAEFTQVYANQYGSKIVPSPHAEPLTEEMRKQAGTPHKPDSPSHPANVAAAARPKPLPVRRPSVPAPVHTTGRAAVGWAIPVLTGVVIGRFAWKRYHHEPATAEVLGSKWAVAADKWKKLGRLFVARRGERYAMTHGPAGRAGPSWEDVAKRTGVKA